MSPAPAAAGPVIFIHSSDEHYGADRILLDLLDALPDGVRERAEFWLPTDVEHGPRPLCTTLESRGATVRHVDLPVLRRAYRTPRHLARLALRAWRLRARLRRLDPALVYCTTSAVLPAAPVARSLRGTQVVGHVQEMWSRSDAAVLRPLAASCQRLLAISGPVRQALPDSLRDRTTVVLNATREPSRYVPLEDRTGPLHFLVASRWNGWKGHRTLLGAWDTLDSPGRLTVLGGLPPSGDAVDVPALVERLRHPERVAVVGEVDDVEPYLEAADVVLVPSDQPEPFGLVAIESFARGRPVVASRGGGLVDIVDDTRDGWLFTPGDVHDLARVVSGLTRADVNRAGATARATYEDRFTASRYAAEWRRAVGLA